MVAMVLLAALMAAMLAAHLLAGHAGRQAADAATRVASLENATEHLRVLLQQAKHDQAVLAAEATKATKGVEALWNEVASLRARLDAMGTVPTAAAAPPAPAPAPAPAAPVAGAPPHFAELSEEERNNPPPLFEAARKAYREKGIAGLCAAIGLGAEAQARLTKAYDALLPQVRAAEKAHAQVTIDGDAVVINIALYPEAGHALQDVCQALLAETLVPAEQKAFADARGDVVLFERPFGHYTQTITLTRDAKGVAFRHTGTRAGGAPTFEDAGTIAGADAVDRLPWRHLLPDAAIAHLQGGAAEF